MGRNLGGGCAPLFERWSLVPIQHNVALAEAYLHAKCHLDQSSCLATVDMGRPTQWHLDPSSHLATTDMGRKLGGCAPLEEGSWVAI